MLSTTSRIAVAAVVAALLLSGCSFTARRTATVEAKQEATRAELSTLRQENEVLKRNQAETLKQLESLQRTLKKDKAEQRRFREMMATNFDLLEQSVALSLSKTMGQKPVVQPNELKLPTATKHAAPAPTAMNQPRAMPPAPATGQKTGQIAGQKTGGKTMGAPMAMPPAPDTGNSRDAEAVRDAKTPATPRNDAAATGDGAQARPVAMVSGAGQREEPFSGEDPDLNPPAAPRRLSSHREAKALYDKGFSHFAHKDYDRAVLVYEEFLARFPQDIYSDNAQFWIGESYFHQQRFGDAEAAYRQVLRNYAHRSSLEGYKTPESIYRIGQTWLKREDARRAKFYFTAAVERFPETSAGRKAQRELATLAVKTADTVDPANPSTRGPGS